MKKPQSVSAYFAQLKQWQPEAIRLREIMASTGLSEALKWGMPVYSSQGKNVVGIGVTKNYVGLWFFQGALLSDTASVLLNAQEGKTRAMRQWRFSSKNEIKVRLIKKYVREATDHVEQGKQIKPERNKPVVISPELKQALLADAKTKSCFNALSLSLRREYADYVSDAKRNDTKLRRIEKIIPMIQASKGLHDKYRKC